MLDLSAVQTRTEIEVYSAVLDHGGNNCWVHPFKVDSHIPYRERRAGWASNEPIWLELNLEASRIVPMRLLREVPGCAIIAHSSEVHSMKALDV